LAWSSFYRKASARLNRAWVGQHPVDRLPPPENAKRTITRANLSKTVGNAVASTPAFIPALVKPKTSSALREKIMLEVSAINDCGYCKWGPTYLAVAQGVPLEEINQIFGYQDEALVANDEAEAAAILFAQHYAENMDEIDQESLATLREHYTDAQVAEIVAYVRAITLGNLTGNTLDALLDKIRDLRVRPAVARVARDLGDPTRRVSYPAGARIAGGQHVAGPRLRHAFGWFLIGSGIAFVLYRILGA
jgi:AhpD family alkylhydroperoxidase